MLELLEATYASPLHDRHFSFQPGVIRWSNGAEHVWTPLIDNDAGDVVVPWGMPNHIIEKQHELIIIYSEGMARLVYCGPPFIYQLSLYHNETTPVLC